MQANVSTENTEWRGGAVAGLAGGAVMGVLLSVMMTPVIGVAIPSMYGLTGGFAGWVIHMAHAAVLGVGFAALARATDVHFTAKSVGGGSPTASSSGSRSRCYRCRCGSRRSDRPRTRRSPTRTR